MNQDEQNVHLLAIFHYVLAGIVALFACFPLLHLAIGIAMVGGMFHGSDAPPAFLGWIFIVIGGAAILIGWTIAILVFIAARCLHRRVRHGFCFVVAAIECIFMPFGTVLGVFTIIVLSKESVKQLFAGQVASPPML